MTSRIYTDQLFIPAMTAIATPVSQAVVLDDKQLDRVEIVIPDGHAGLTGIAVTWGGTQVAPYIAGTWVSGNGETISYAYDGEITATGLVLAGYNTDIYDHTFYLRFYLSDLTGVSPVVVASAQAAPAGGDAALLAVAALSGGG